MIPVGNAHDESRTGSFNADAVMSDVQEFNSGWTPSTFVKSTESLIKSSLPSMKAKNIQKVEPHLD